MQLFLFDQTIHYTNEISAIDECFEKINQAVFESDYVLSHLEIDGVEVYEDYHEYLTNHITSVKEIVVKVKTYQQILNVVVLDLKSYLDRAIPETKQLADDFYKSPDKDAWTKLTQLLEGLQWIMQALEPLYTVRGNDLPYPNSLVLSAISTELTEQFHELEMALKNTDLVLVGDLLKYEVVDRLGKLSSELQITIDNGVVPRDLN